MEITVYSEVGKTRPAFVYYVDGEKAGTTVQDVKRLIAARVVGVKGKYSDKLIRDVCADAKRFGRSMLFVAA